MATAKHNFQKLVFNPAGQKLVDFLDKFQKLVKNAFGKFTQAIIEQFMWAKMPSYLKKSKNQTRLEKTHLNRLSQTLKKNWCWTVWKLLWANMPSTRILTRPNQRATTVKKTGNYRNQSHQLKRQKQQAECIASRIKNSGANNSITNNSNINEFNNKTSNRADGKPKTAYSACETFRKSNHSIQKSYFGDKAANQPPPRNRRPEGKNDVEQRDNQNNSNENGPAADQILIQNYHVLTLELQLTDLRWQNNTSTIPKSCVIATSGDHFK